MLPCCSTTIENNVTCVIPKRNYIVVELEGYKLFCAYFFPNISIQSFTDEVRNLLEDCRASAGEYLLLRDFNAKSHLWGSPTTDVRGDIISEWTAALNLIPLNDGREPTFVRGVSKSFIDVTFAAQQLATREKNWKVLEEDSLTVHKCIMFDISDNKVRRGSWTVRVLDVATFRRVLNDSIVGSDRDMRPIHHFQRVVGRTYRSSLAQPSARRRRGKAPFW